MHMMLYDGAILIIIIIIRNLNRSQTEQYPNKGKTYSSMNN